MNPQYLSPQQFGGPPQGFPPTSRVSPNTTSPLYQSSAVGPPKSGQLPPQNAQHAAPPGAPNFMSHPSSLQGQLPPSLSGQLPRPPIPSNQLPPSIGHDLGNSFGPPPTKNDNIPSGNLQNGPPNFQSGPPQFQNGQPAPTSQPNRPPSNFIPPNQNQFGPSPTSNPNMPPRPSSNQPSNMGQPPLPSGPPTQFGQPPLSAAPPVSSAPLVSNAPPTSSGPPTLSSGPPTFSGPPLSSGPPISSGSLALSSGSAELPSDSQIGHPGAPPNQPRLSGGAPPNQPRLSGGVPPNQPRLSGGSPPNHPRLSGGAPPQMVPNPQVEQQSLPGAPPPHIGQPPLPNPPSHLGQPNLARGPPQHIGQPGGPPSQLGHPPLPSYQGQQPSQFDPQGPMPQQNGPPNTYGNHPNQFNNQMGPPKMGQFPPQQRPLQPPLPGQQQMPGQSPIINASGPYAPSTGPGHQMPPHAGQPPYGPGQITSQLQQMNLSGPKPAYPVPQGGPMRPMNGEGGPHMPPPVNQPGYVNNQQGRGPPGPGYPPMPGQAPMQGQGYMPSQGQYPGPGTGYPQGNYQQAAPQHKIDPDHVPNPIQVIRDDQRDRDSVFVTNQKGLVPPMVTTNFIVQDQGNCSPRFIRSTIYNVPVSQDLLKQSALQFSLLISPMARQVEQEYPPPIVNFGALGPVRCIRCKAYMCPFMQFVDSGRRFQCLFCNATTDVPTEYFQHLDQTGLRMDRFERPELILGTYEFVATPDYCRNNVLPKPPAIVFVVDVSYNNIKSGMVSLLCSQMKEIIQNLPVDQGHEKSNMKVGFITYNSTVHFYNIKGSLTAPQMLVVGDVQEMFMPLLDGFLCTPEESGPVIDLLMQQIPAMFADTKETEIVLLPAIQAGLEALKASETTGKLLVFHSTLPIADAPGKLKNRDDRKLLGTDKEKTILTPQSQAYNQLGQDCVSNGCSVDLYLFNNAYIDIATIGQVSRLTGGEVFKYTYFQADLDGERLITDVILNISRPIAFDAVMRVRTSTGVRPTDFYGHFYMSNTTDIELAAIDCDKAIAVEIKHDDKLSEDTGVFIQTALLYTSCSGQRRLRIMNLSLKTCSQMADLFRSCDLDTLINYMSKQATYKLLDTNPSVVKEGIVHRSAQILAIYRKHCASPSSAGQLILPECMKLLPIYTNCLLKNDAISGGSDMAIDDKSFVMQAVMSMDLNFSVYYFYPRLIPLHDIDPNQETITIPNPIRCSYDKMNEQGVYILENGIHMFLWFGLGVNPNFIQQLFGAPSAIQVDIDRSHLPELDNPLSIAVRTIIDEIRIQKHRCMRLTLVRQREKLEPVFKHFLVEDCGTDGSASYVDFLCHMHREIRNILS